MTYDERLAERVEDLLGVRRDATPKRMFGGIAWMVNGNMAVVVRGKGGLMVRVSPDDHDALLAEPGAATTAMRGHPMRGWITVSPEACTEPSDVAAWVDRGLAYALSLPSK
ncbi:TfoX/Sxy family transcriptional regulator of competence genes [Actinomadura coerulea]|uniref:TfoX/Sxy family transcriptional regulator of competence genes n=1 Tax=Actinomadura coerulea TaxID=46159 RepID=A0A7X0KX71_9ACTN|nr:TfoX/Sxy family transcriptional regulator of competence genes [Actinomadura coerulea]